MLFKTNIEVYKHYYYRSRVLELEDETKFLKIKKIFSPVFNKLIYKTEPLIILTEINIGKKLLIKYENNYVKIDTK